MKRLVLGLCVLLFLVASCYAISVLLKKPSNDRNWDIAFSKLNTVDDGPNDTLIIHNLRDFTYATGTRATTTWKDVTINPDDIESIWFFLDHFKSDTPEIGHTFISFRMKDGSTVAFSIEARREATEKYSFIGGFVRDFDLQYLWGTERDLIGQRVVYKNEQLYMFPLSISHEDARTLMVDFAEETNALAEHPRFYNTFTANCTNLLADIVNHYHPHTLPYDISWNLTGLADGYLEKEGFIKTNGASRAAFRITHDLTAHRSELAAHQSATAIEFSDFVRTLVR